MRRIFREIAGPVVILGVSVACIVVLLAVLRDKDHHTADVLYRFQSLIGAVIALTAALIAYGNITRQISTQKTMEEERRRSEHRQLASALVGEIEGINHLFECRRMLEYYGEYAKKNEASATAEDWWPMAVTGGYTEVYDKAGANLGMLPDDLPEKVGKYYVELRAVFDRIAAAERGIYTHKKDGAAAAFMARVLIEEIRDVARRGTDLVLALRQFQELA